MERISRSPEETGRFKRPKPSYEDIAETKGLKLLKSIGEGSYGVVYSASKDGKFYAIKFYKNPGELEIERNNLIRIGHFPYIVTFFEDLSGSSFNTFEYMDMNLHDFIYNSAHRPRANDIAKIFQQLLSATEYLHRHELIHADIKPGNILANNDRMIFKLADFGSIIDSSDEICHQKSTVVYAAPEILLYNCTYGQNPFTIKADMWSLGCTFFEVICQRRLFTQKSTTGVIENYGKLGRPMVDNYPDRVNLDLIVIDSGKDPILFRKYFDIIVELLRFDPWSRLSASEALALADKLNATSTIVIEGRPVELHDVMPLESEEEIIALTIPK